ncbi:hypothetical protein CSUI_005101, partial [Cystoisospora suis]
SIRGSFPVLPPSFLCKTTELLLYFSLVSKENEKEKKLERESPKKQAERQAPRRLLRMTYLRLFLLPLLPLDLHLSSFAYASGEFLFFFF